jgi:hypothetical protein
MASCKKPLAFCKSTIREKFWLDDFSELYKDNKFTRFFPKHEMTRTEQLNALTRMFIYYIIILLIFGKSENWLYIPITAIVVIVIIYNIHTSDEKGKEKEFFRILDIRKSKKDAEQAKLKEELKHDGEEEIDLSDLETTDEEQDYTLEAGYIDSDGTLVGGTELDEPPYIREKPESLFTVDELVDYQKNTCRRPTHDNPFMNPPISDFNNGDPPAACNSNDEDINNTIRVNFNHDLFRDVDELWERKNSQRQFYTIPNTAIPNNQTEFARWLYGVPTTCKEDGVKCLRYENLKHKR